MPAYVVVEIDQRPRDLSALQGAGAAIVRGAPAEPLEGNWCPPRLVILEFPTAEQARSWWSSSDYAVAKALRQSSASTDMVLVEGVSTIS